MKNHFGMYHTEIKVEDFESVYRDIKAKGADFVGEPFVTYSRHSASLLKDNGAIIELVTGDPEVLRKVLVKGEFNW